MSNDPREYTPGPIPDRSVRVYERPYRLLGSVVSGLRLEEEPLLLDVLCALQMVDSPGAAKRAVQGASVSVNGEKVADLARRLTRADLQSDADKIIVLQVGKTLVHVVVDVKVPTPEEKAVTDEIRRRVLDGRK